MAVLKATKKGPKLFRFDLHKSGGKKSKLTFEGGTAVRNLAAGKYMLIWVVEGLEGQTFSYSVTLDDKKIEEQKDAEISDAGWETGGIPLEVEDEE